jgi:hypothetical protein
MWSVTCCFTAWQPFNARKWSLCRAIVVNYYTVLYYLSGDDFHSPQALRPLLGRVCPSSCQGPSKSLLSKAPIMSVTMHSQRSLFCAQAELRTKYVIGGYPLLFIFPAQATFGGPTICRTPLTVLRPVSNSVTSLYYFLSKANRSLTVYPKALMDPAAEPSNTGQKIQPGTSLEGSLEISWPAPSGLWKSSGATTPLSPLQTAVTGEMLWSTRLSPTYMVLHAV